MESGSSESEPEEANGGESEEADEPYSTIWRAAGPLAMRQDMQHDSQVLYSLRAGDLVKQTKPAVTVRTTGRKYVHVSTVVAATGQEVVGWGYRVFARSDSHHDAHMTHAYRIPKSGSTGTGMAPVPNI